MIYRSLRLIYRSLRFFLVPILVFEFYLNRFSLKRGYKYIVNYHWSFGHQFLYLDWVRRSNPQGVLCCIYIDDCYQISRLFPDVYFYKYKCLIFGKSRAVNLIREKLTLFLLKQFYGTKYGIELIDKQDFYYKDTFSHYIKIYDDNQMKQYYNIYDYFDKLENDNICRPRLSESDKIVAKKLINEKYKNLKWDRPTAVVQLRGKIGDNKDFTNVIRNPGDIKNYLGIADNLVKRGYNVFGLGEANFKSYNSLEGFYDVSHYTDKIVGLFLQTTCDVFVGQHSGSLLIPASCGSRLFISDAMMYWQAIPGNQNYILYKRCYLNGNLLDIQSISNSKSILFGDLEHSSVSILPNTVRDINQNFINFMDNKDMPQMYNLYPLDSLPYYAKNIIGEYYE